MTLSRLWNERLKDHLWQSVRMHFKNEAPLFENDAHEPFHAIIGTNRPLFSPLQKGIFGLRNHAWDN